MNSGGRKVSKSMSARRKMLRDGLWPGLDESKLWLRSQRVGFTTIPRTMALVGRILDQLSDKGFPLSSTYLTLWCWVFDEAFVEIRNPKEFAFESGFSGPRGEATWRGRMRRLAELGFIDAKPGLAGEFQYVLIFNPIKVIDLQYADKNKDHAYKALLSRLAEIGADDLDEIAVASD
ncbi:hypothetical protein [Chitinimonas sp. JJ19]|uniref:hypothetical protein n=1 Tax=Chitinimonas sp. JJ19 TaxID=3109352 RepID=UPI003001D45E